MKDQNTPTNTLEELKVSDYMDVYAQTIADATMIIDKDVAEKRVAEVRNKLEEDFQQRLKDKVSQAVNKALINEWHSIGNWNSDRGVEELWEVIEKRLAELNRDETPNQVEGEK